MALYVQSTRCKVCLSPLREQVDAMLLGETRRPDGMPYRVEDIVEWAADKGEQLSAGGLSRHRTNHLMPALGAALEAQQVMEAISKSTGKQMSLQVAFTNVLIHKLLRYLEDFDAKEVDPKQVAKLLETGVKAVQASLQLEKAERVFTKETAEKVSDGLRKRGLSAEAIAEIEREVLGFVR
ncbi:MAG: phage protein Gp27 family protein [Meiothermus sp.]|nr:phage protein Gp27 family protein [Meiothermus sp.]